MIDRSAEIIDDLEYDAAYGAILLLNAARSAGIPLVVISGRRSTQVNRDVGGAARSHHLFGRAFDVAVVGYTVAQLPTWWWERLGRYGEGLGMRWGGRFHRADLNHFDLGEYV